MGRRGRTFEWAARINGLLLLRAHGEPVNGAARRVREGAATDDALQSALRDASQTRHFDTKLAGLLKAIADEAGYEALVARADEAKRVLRRAHGAT